MAHLFCDSCQYIATADIGSKWSSASNFTIGSTASVRSSPALQTTSNAAYCLRSVTVGGTGAIWSGFRYKSTVLNGGMIWTCRDGVNNYSHTGIRVNADGSVSAVKAGNITTPYDGGGGSLGSSAAGVLQANVFAYIEVKELVHASAGYIQIKVNGVSVLNLTSQNTKNANGSATATITQVGFVSDLAGATQTWHDFYALDDSGSVNNTYLGDVRVDGHVPSGNGNSSMSTPSTGTDRYATVDDATPNGDTDYNTLAGVNDKDTLAFPALAAAGAGTVLAFQVALYARKTDAGSGSIAPVVRSGGTDYDGTTVALSTSYGYVIQPYDVNPDTSAHMTEAEFGSAEFGYKRIA